MLANFLPFVMKSHRSFPKGYYEMNLIRVFFPQTFRVNTRRDLIKFHADIIDSRDDCKLKSW